jgi:hypothetical protein
MLPLGELHGKHAVKKLKLKLIYDRQLVGQSVLVSGSHLGPATDFSFSLKFPSDSWRVCYFVAPSLTRGRVCNFVIYCKLLLDLARAVTLKSKSCRTHGHILLSHLRLPQPGRSGPRIYIPQEQGGPGIPPEWTHLGIVWRLISVPPS